MSSKEVQLSLSFCGALAAILLMSAPINEMTALYSSGFSFLIAAGFFYKGITTYFAEKETQALNAAQQSELTLKEFENQFIQYQNATKSQFQAVIEGLQSLDKNFIQYQNATKSQLQAVIEGLQSLDKNFIQYQNATKSQLQAVIEGLQSLDKNFIQYQNAVNSQLKDVVAAIENLDDTLNDSIAKPLQDVTETVSTMSASVNLIKTGTENIESNTGKIKNLTKTADDISDEIEDLTKNVADLSKNIAEVPQVNETLKELMRTMNQQEEFLQTTLSQYKNMTAKDADIIENLARRLRWTIKQL